MGITPTQQPQHKPEQSVNKLFRTDNNTDKESDNFGNVNIVAIFQVVKGKEITPAIDSTIETITLTVLKESAKMDNTLVAIKKREKSLILNELINI